MHDAVGAQVVEQVAEVIDLVFGQQSFRFRVGHRLVPGEAQQVGSSVGNVFAAAQRFEDGIGSVARLANEADRGVFDDGHADRSSDHGTASGAGGVVGVPAVVVGVGLGGEAVAGGAPHLVPGVGVAQFGLGVAAAAGDEAGEG